MAFNELISLISCLIVLLAISSFAHLTEDPDEAGARFINEWAIHVEGTVADAKAITRQLGFVYHRPVHGLAGFHVLKHRDQVTGYSRFHHHRLRRHAKVRWVEQQKAKLRRKRGLQFNDKWFNRQWYLRKGAKGGFDMNVMAAWKMGYTGKGVVVTILDDGIELTHPDLSGNYDPNASYDINDNDKDPSPRATYDNENKHGTRCAGEVAAVANNRLCNVGVAYNAKIGGVRMLDGDITDSVEGSSLSLRQDHIDIYSGSWGPDDNGKVVDGPGVMAKTAFENGVKTGRGGLGNIFVWASGNGGSSKDSCACDGYAGSIYTLSVSAVSENNKKPWYLEECASTLASTYSSGYSGEKQIITTDLHKSCTDQHTGTSASAPLAAGIIALMLEANKNLTWRDVQYLTLITANPAPFVDAGWITNGVGRKVSLLYGYGLMDAAKMVYLAPLWRRTPEQRTCRVKKTFSVSIYGKKKASVIFPTDACKASSPVNFVEHVLLFLNLDFSRRGALRITLISPAGTRSVLLPPREHDTAGGPTKFDRWPLMSVQFWGERAAGQWRLEVENVGKQLNSGKLKTGTLVIYGVGEQPIRLKSPPTGNSPGWFGKEFRQFVVTDSYKAVKEGQSRQEDDGKQECHEECANATACSGRAASQCTACRHFQLAADNACVPKCPPGTFALGRVCEACHLQCAECSGPGARNCTACRRGSALLPDQRRCLGLGEECPRGSFLSANRSVCAACPSTCETCSSPQRCLSCNGRLVLSPRGRCQEKCPARYFVSPDRRCLACPLSCGECVSGREDGCISCQPSRLLLKTNSSSKAGFCVTSCSPGFYLHAHTCLRCHESCQRCSGPGPRKCSVCRPPLTLHGGVCADPADLRCNDGRYKKRGQCLPCHPSCARCDGGGNDNCLACNRHNDVVFHGRCQSRCPDGFFPLNSTQACGFCHPLCVSCRGPGAGNCTACPPGLKRSAQRACQNPCPSGHFPPACQKCPDSACDVCDANRKCLQCEAGHILVAGRCQVGGACPDRQGSLYGRCVPCPDPDCLQCAGAELTECRVCRQKFRLFAGKCLPPQQCRANEFIDASFTCRRCHHRCRTCSGSSDTSCSSCRSDSCLVLGVCRPCCWSSNLSTPSSPYACANCSLGASPRCLLPDHQVSSPPLPGLLGKLPGPMRLLMVAALMLCALLPILYLAIFCALQLRAGEPVLCCVQFRPSRRLPGHEYAPLATNAASPEKRLGGEGVLEMTPRKLGLPHVLIPSSKDSDESSGVGSSPDKSPDRQEGILTA